MKDWSVGLFEADWTGTEPTPPAFDAIPEAERPAALDRAALEASVGSPFFPGIETGYVIARRDPYEAPFRIVRSKAPGDLTAEMAVPWQADFIECATLWWPGQRPDIVRRNGAFADWIPPEWMSQQGIQRIQHVEMVTGGASGSSCGGATSSWSRSATCRSSGCNRGGRIPSSGGPQGG